MDLAREIKKKVSVKMGRKRRKYSVKFDVAKNMPPLYHTLPGQEFDVEKSQVYKWIKEQPEFWEYIRDTLRQAGYIVYNSETGQWTGIDYEEENRNEVHYERGHF